MATTQNETKVTQWLRGAIAAGVAKAGVIRVSNVKAARGMPHAAELPWQPGETDQGELVKQICEACRSDAEVYGGKQTYKVGLHVADSEDEAPRASLLLRFEGGEGEAPVDGSATSLVATLVRHLDTKERQMAASLGTVLEANKQVLLALVEENKGLRASRDTEEKRRLETYELIEDMLSMRQERDLQAETLRHEESRKAKMFEGFTQLLPVIVNKIAGRVVLPTSHASGLKGFIESFTPEQLEKLASVLTPQQFMHLETLVSSLDDEEKAKS